MTNYAKGLAEEEVSCQLGAFFCHACLNDKPATEASLDPRYCQGCYGFLEEESEKVVSKTNCLELVMGKDTSQKHHEKAQDSTAKRDIIKRRVVVGVSAGVGIMSTVEGIKYEVVDYMGEKCPQFVPPENQGGVRG